MRFYAKLQLRLHLKSDCFWRRDGYKCTDNIKTFASLDFRWVTHFFSTCITCSEGLVCSTTETDGFLHVTETFHSLQLPCFFVSLIKFALPRPSAGFQMTGVYVRHHAPIDRADLHHQGPEWIFWISFKGWNQVLAESHPCVCCHALVEAGFALNHGVNSNQEENLKTTPLIQCCQGSCESLRRASSVGSAAALSCDNL